jgi:hypothetical protein
MEYWKNTTIFTLDFAATVAGILMGLPFLLIALAPFTLGC